MADRRKNVPNPSSETYQETDRQFMDKNNVNGMIKELLAKLIANRPDDPMRFIANYFETLNIEDQSNDLVNRAVQILNLTQHNRPIFETNVRSAFDVLTKNKITKKLHGVNGLIHSQLMQALCKELPSAVTIRLFKKLECAEHEAVSFDVFRASIFTCCVLTDFVTMTSNLFHSLDMQHTGKADKHLCDAAMDQLRTALASSRTDVKRIVESSYSLSPDGLYNALSRAMSNHPSQGFYTQDQFVLESCEIFLSKVKRLR